MDLEITAMSKVAEALEGLDADARNRVLKWADDRYGIRITTEVRSERKPALAEENLSIEDYETFADLFVAASPSTQPEMLLVAGYWYQEIQGRNYIESVSINKELKNLGHAISRISDVFQRLQAQDQPAGVGCGHSWAIVD